MDFNRIHQTNVAIEYLKSAKKILETIGPEERAVYDELMKTAPQAPKNKTFLVNAASLEDANDCIGEALDYLKQVTL
jgi:hypothetical protein